MNMLRKFNEMRRRPLTVTIKVTATAQNGETKSTEAVIRVNQLNQLGGSGLSGQNLYDLSKKGRCETADGFGTKFVFEILPPATKQVKGEKDEKST